MNDYWIWQAGENRLDEEDLYHQADPEDVAIWDTEFCRKELTP